MSADDGIVTSLGFDNEWIVVGMANSQVHVFDAERGDYLRSLYGHELGVWCLVLVSKGGGPRLDQQEQGSGGEGLFDEGYSVGGTSASAGGRGSRGRRNFTMGSGTPGPASNGTSRSRASTSPTAPKRRRSSLDGATGPSAAVRDGVKARFGGMGLGAGGETGDSPRQAEVCGTARGWGQKGAVVVSGGCDRDIRVW